MRVSVVTALGLSLLPLVIGVSNTNAGSDTSVIANPKSDNYRDYFLDVSQITDRQNYSAIINSLHHQLDIVEEVGLSPRLLKFFHQIPIVVDEAACLGLFSETEHPQAAAGCYVSDSSKRLQPQKPRLTAYWDSQKSEWISDDPLAVAEASNRGVVMLRTGSFNPEAPMVLHEMLHAYHQNMMPDRFDDKSVKYWFKEAKGLYPEDAYLMSNAKEFFAVTASIFLYGKDYNEPFTRAKLKEKQPLYYKWLAWLFEFDPDNRSPGTPVAAAN